MSRLENKVAIITGAASGMGKATAILFADQGAKVVLADLELPPTEAVVAEIEKKHPGVAIAVACDVASEEAVNTLFKKTLDKFGTLDILINNAGVMDNFSPVHEVTNQTWEKVLSINLYGPMYTMRKAIQFFLTKNKTMKGSIVNIASISGIQGARGGVSYTASKWALVGITENTAFVYSKSGIRVVCPGAVATNISKSIVNPSKFGGERITPGYTALNPRIGSPEEVANTVLFLASDEASFVNGATVVADAGWTAY